MPDHPPVIDPDNIAETLCDGLFNVGVSGNLATLTFTHIRTDPASIGATTVQNSVVRARIVLTFANLLALRDVLNQVGQDPGRPVPLAGGSVKH